MLKGSDFEYNKFKKSNHNRETDRERVMTMSKHVLYVAYISLMLWSNPASVQPANLLPLLHSLEIRGLLLAWHYSLLACISNVIYHCITRLFPVSQMVFIDYTTATVFFVRKP